MAAKHGPDIPVLKEDKKEKKGAGLVLPSSGSSSGGGIFYRWLGGGARAGGQAALAAKGGLVPAFLNFTGSNAALVLMTSMLSLGAAYTMYSVGMSTARKHDVKTGKVFPDAEAPKIEGMAEPSTEEATPSSLNYFMTANTGKAFDNDPTDGAPAENAQAGEAKPAEPEIVSEVVEMANPVNTNMADALKQAMEKPEMVAARGFRGGGRPLGGGNGLAGGTGLSGGFVRPFEQQKSPTGAAGGKLTAPPSNKKMTVSRMTKPISRVEGPFAVSQLKFANKKSRVALGMTSSEGRAYEAANAFTTAPPAAGGTVSGGGGLGVDSAGLTGGPNSDGGPIGGGYTGYEQMPGSGKTSDKSPWTGDVLAAMSLLMTASTIITVIGILALYKGIPIIGQFIQGIQLMLFGVAAGMAGTATALGAMIMSKHEQMEQGLILTTGGALTTATAVASLAAPQSMPSWAVVLGGVAGIAATVGALLAGMMKK